MWALTALMDSAFSMGNVEPGKVRVRWQAPTLFEDGSSLQDLTGYNLYYGTHPANLSQSITVGSAEAALYPAVSGPRQTLFRIDCSQCQRRRKCSFRKCVQTDSLEQAEHRRSPVTDTCLTRRLDLQHGQHPACCHEAVMNRMHDSASAGRVRSRSSLPVAGE